MLITFCLIFETGKAWIMDSSLAHANFGSLHTTVPNSELQFGFGACLAHVEFVFSSEIVSWEFYESTNDFNNIKPLCYFYSESK